MPAIKEKVKEEFEECPFCGWPDIMQNEDGLKRKFWTCLSCFMQWDEDGMV